MQLLRQEIQVHISGGKAETVRKRAEDIVSDLTKINNYAKREADQITRLEENFELLQKKRT